MYEGSGRVVNEDALRVRMLLREGKSSHNVFAEGLDRGGLTPAGCWCRVRSARPIDIVVRARSVRIRRVSRRERYFSSTELKRLKYGSCPVVARTTSVYWMWAATGTVIYLLVRCVLLMKCNFRLCGTWRMAEIL